MNKIWIVIQREYISSVYQKSFILLTLLAPLLMIGGIALVSYFTMANLETEKVFVLDEAQITHKILKGNKKLEIEYLAPNTGLKAANDSLQNNEDAKSLLYIPLQASKKIGDIEANIKLNSKKKLSNSSTLSLESQLKELIRGVKTKELNLDPNLIAQIESKLNLTSSETIVELIDGEISEKKDNGLNGVKLALAYFFNFLSYIMIMMYGVKIMQSVVEEKSSRIIEIIISSIKPFQLLMGKLIAGTLAAFTQLITWILVSVLCLTLGKTYIENSDKLESLKGALAILDLLAEANVGLTIAGFIAFFILGYALYGAIFAAIGSGVENDKEAQQFTFPVTLPLLVGFYVLVGSVAANQSVEGPVIYALSFFPLTSPVIMVARIPFGVPLWEVLVSILILIFTIILIIKFAAKIYRTGILMYGKKASFKEFMKWLKY